MYSSCVRKIGSKRLKIMWQRSNAIRERNICDKCANWQIGKCANADF